MSHNPEPQNGKCLCQVRHVKGVAIVDLSGPLTLAGGAGIVRSTVGINTPEAPNNSVRTPRRRHECRRRSHECVRHVAMQLLDIVIS